jgi:nicotinate phosphoribosyltransferase
VNIVIKMVAAVADKGEWTPVVKLSDDRGKYTGDDKTFNLAKSILNIR